MQSPVVQQMQPRVRSRLKQESTRRAGPRVRSLGKHKPARYFVDSMTRSTVLQSSTPEEPRCPLQRARHCHSHCCCSVRLLPSAAPCQASDRRRTQLRKSGSRPPQPARSCPVRGSVGSPKRARLPTLVSDGLLEARDNRSSKVTLTPACLPVFCFSRGQAGPVEASLSRA